MEGDETVLTPGDDRLDRAIRLFEFLARIQQIKSQTIRTFETYERDGDVIWLHSLPDDPAIKSMHRHGAGDPSEPILTIDRVPHPQPPVPPEVLAQWLSNGIDDPSQPPTLLLQRTVYPEPDTPRIDDGPVPDDGTIDSEIEIQNLTQFPLVSSTFERWIALWSSWAEDELRLRPIREAYARLFSVRIAASSHPEELEVVCGAGCLGWRPVGHEHVHRHAFVMSAAIDFDDATGRLTVRPIETADTLSLELDMLAPDVVRDYQRINDIREAASSLQAHPLDREEVSLLGRRLVHSLDPDGQYLDDDLASPIEDHPIIAFAPAIILRKRSKLGLIQVFQSIVSQIKQAGKVPEGLLPLVDPNHQPDPGLAWDGTDGALVRVDEDIFLPLPVNEAQLRVINRVDSSAQTLVQGPPGTGKTHTAAALISHLLAQGKRVLVTAQTDRALKEVRAKLPEAIKPLSVAVVGTGREDMADLKVAVERIASAATDHEPELSERAISQHLDEIDRSRRQRSDVHRRLIEAREREVHVYDLPERQGTLATIALEYETLREQYGWISTLVRVAEDTRAPLTNQEVWEWRQILLNAQLRQNETEARQGLLEPSSLRAPEDFRDLVVAERNEAAKWEALSGVIDHPAFPALAHLSPESLVLYRSNFRWLSDEAAALSQSSTSWTAQAVIDTHARRTTPWRARHHKISSLVANIEPQLPTLGHVQRVSCDVDPGLLIPLANTLRTYLDRGGKIKVTSSGQPRLGGLASREVKNAEDLFSHVRVDGLPPTSVASVDYFLAWANIELALDELDRAWPEGLSVPREDTQSERLYWHVAELELLDRVIALATRIDQLDLALAEMGLRNTNWSDPSTVPTLCSVIDALEAKGKFDAARSPLEDLTETTQHVARLRNAASCVHSLVEAIQLRDVDKYGLSWDRLHELQSLRALAERRDYLESRLLEAAPMLVSQVRHEPDEQHWDQWLPELEQAWQWAATGAWIARHEQVDVNLLQRQLDVIEEDIRGHVEHLSAQRAWRHAVSPDRMTGQARADLEQYAYLVRRLGKGTSVKFGATRRGEIREAMDRCRPSVPVWILPIYRIAEQLRIAPDIFDVVIVDEASQAGLDATFLQYLAPKIVVIGDDKQVSPSAVGVDQQELRDLANQYLYDDTYRASWQDPKRSLFDEAKMRYGGLTTLVEHRRCVPEIIGFSNRVAYEPEGIRLIPVRQYGVDRLEPIKPVFLAEGYMRGSQNRVNPVECEAIVDQMEKCLADPAYDGMTFGVISLLGPAQAKLIEKALLDRISPEVWTARDLRCGDSADFQGSERNVMFLSMVAAVEPDRRLLALTTEMYLQRYNVAASRAMDQMWLFHSVELSDLSNTEDLRFQLLDYCYGTVARSNQIDSTYQNPVPEDIRVDPFDSLFEQRVFNRLIDRGYNVIPQYPVEGYKIDLVIVGSKTKVAIECDGDFWHGPDRYEADLARKRDLERNGWKFFNIRESLFYVDRAAALAPLWDTLESLEVHPSGWVPPSEPERREASTGPYEGRSEPQIPHIPLETELFCSESSSLPSQPLTDGDTAAGVSVDVRPELVESRQVFEDVRAVPHSVVTGPTEDLPSDDRRLTTGSPSNGGLLETYSAFTGRTTPALDATPQQLINELVDIVGIEGPVLGERLHQAHVRASGGHRVGGQIAHALNSAISKAKQLGLLIEEDPLSDGGVKPKTYRLPTQTGGVPRTLGPRTLDQVPPRELAAVIAAVAAERGPNDEETLFRTVLDRYGLRRYTVNAISLLRRAQSLILE